MKLTRKDTTAAKAMDWTLWGAASALRVAAVTTGAIGASAYTLALVVLSHFAHRDQTTAIDDHLDHPANSPVGTATAAMQTLACPSDMRRPDRDAFTTAYNSQTTILQRAFATQDLSDQPVCQPGITYKTIIFGLLGLGIMPTNIAFNFGPLFLDALRFAVAYEGAPLTTRLFATFRTQRRHGNEIELGAVRGFDMLAAVVPTLPLAVFSSNALLYYLSVPSIQNTCRSIQQIFAEHIDMPNLTCTAKLLAMTSNMAAQDSAIENAIHAEENPTSTLNVGTVVAAGLTGIQLLSSFFRFSAWIRGSALNACHSRQNNRVQQYQVIPSPPHSPHNEPPENSVDQFVNLFSALDSSQQAAVRDRLDALAAPLPGTPSRPAS